MWLDSGPRAPGGGAHGGDSQARVRGKPIPIPLGTATGDSDSYSNSQYPREIPSFLPSCLRLGVGLGLCPQRPRESGMSWCLFSSTFVLQGKGKPLSPHRVGGARGSQGPCLSCPGLVVADGWRRRRGNGAPVGGAHCPQEIAQTPYVRSELTAEPARNDDRRAGGGRLGEPIYEERGAQGLCKEGAVGWPWATGPRVPAWGWRGLSAWCGPAAYRPRFTLLPPLPGAGRRVVRARALLRHPRPSGTSLERLRGLDTSCPLSSCSSPHDRMLSPSGCCSEGGLPFLSPAGVLIPRPGVPPPFWVWSIPPPHVQQAQAPEPARPHAGPERVRGSGSAQRPQPGRADSRSTRLGAADPTSGWAGRCASPPLTAIIHSPRVSESLLATCCLGSLTGKGHGTLKRR
ncbi:uncharacterized protein LOC116668219 [Camelus ferus]|uniref:Uncharacterized protein LOC116668219 n=2 Tax=Camelus TaxID=9836 RepID=A0A8B8U9J5_CAMFR|nr:uncharacterized protein LOC116668219 [Camelus ferus]XP_045374557.1 uncharacterized protein LOC123617572 [Camelus bactrianus]